MFIGHPPSAVYAGVGRSPVRINAPAPLGFAARPPARGDAVPFCGGKNSRTPESSYFRWLSCGFQREQSSLGTEEREDGGERIVIGQKSGT